MIIPRIKYFARADYEGLSRSSRKLLKSKRSEYARELNKIRNLQNEELKKTDFSGGRTIRSTSNLSTSKFDNAAEAISHTGLGTDPVDNYKKHRKMLWKLHLEQAEDASNTMREKMLERDLARKKLLRKRLGYAALGVAGTAALAYGGKKLYDKHKKDKETTDQDSKATKEFSETKEKVRKGLEYTSTGLGLGTGIGLGTAGYYGLKATKKGLDGISAYEGKTVKGLLKNKEVKEAADLIKRSFKNGDVRLKGNGKKALNTAAGLAAASIVAGGASKLLGKNKDSKK